MEPMAWLPSKSTKVTNSAFKICFPVLATLWDLGPLIIELTIISFFLSWSLSSSSLVITLDNYFKNTFLYNLIDLEWKCNSSVSAYFQILTRYFLLFLSHDALLSLYLWLHILTYNSIFHFPHLMNKYWYFQRLCLLFWFSL